MIKNTKYNFMKTVDFMVVTGIHMEDLVMDDQTQLNTFNMFLKLHISCMLTPN